MTRTASLLLLSLLALLSFAMPCQAANAGMEQPPAPSISLDGGNFPTGELQELLDQAVARGIPGVVIAVASPEGAYLSASGVADLETGERMTSSHALRVGLATEMYTASLIWSLIEDGRLALTDKASRRLRASLGPNTDTITIGMLLNHTSGLYDFTESPKYIDKMNRSPNHKWTSKEILSIVRANPLKFTPGTQFRYSTSDDYVLGLIAEAVTGRTVEKLLQQRLFEPNGMARTAVSRNGGLPAMSTPGYVWRDGQERPTSVGGWSFSGQWAAGGGTSTSMDMLVWARGLLTGTVLDPATRDRAWTVDLPSMTGYGFEVTRNAYGFLRAGRIGVKPGSTTDFLIYPEQGRVLFIGFNISDERSAPTLDTLRIIRDLRDSIERLLGWNEETSYTETRAAGRVAVQKLLDDYRIPSASLALVDHDRVAWSETFGYIDKETQTPPGPDTMFSIGSVSKIIAAMAVMRLVEQGKLELDAPVVRYLPDFRMLSPEYSQITVRMLLDHASGFGGADFRNMFTFYAPHPGYAASVMEALAGERLKHTPGYLSVYCNDGVTMVDPLVEAVTGASYPQFIHDEILDPLGMTHSRFSLQPFAPGTYAPGYHGDTPQPLEFNQPYASGGLYTTPVDIARAEVMLMNGGMIDGVRFLSAGSIAEMGRDQTKALPFNPVPTFARGLGWDNVHHSGLDAVGVRAWHKKGGTTIYETDVIVAPSEGLALMLTTSGRSRAAGMPAEQIMLHALIERGVLPTMPRALADNPLPEKRLTRAQLSAIIGNYANKDMPVRVELQPETSDTLRLMGYDIDSAGWVEMASGLKQRIDGTFSSDEAPNVSYRALVADGRRYLAKAEPIWTGFYREESPYAEEIKPAAAPLSAAWRGRVGKVWLAVNEDANSAYLAMNLPPRFRLDAISDMPGYLLASSIYISSQIVDPSGSDTLAKMFLLIPMELGRDLNDVVIESHGGEEWVRYGSTLYRPQAGAPDIPAGQSEVTIGSEGYAEWRRAPETGEVSIAGSTAWKIYNASLELQASGSGGGGGVIGSAGSYIMLYGDPGAIIHLTFAPSS